MLYFKDFRQTFLAFSIILPLCFAVKAQSESKISSQIDISNLIQEVSRSTQANAIADFAYKFNFLVREMDKKGAVKKIDSLVYETFIPSRLPRKTVSLPMIQLEKNGKPLPPAEIESQRQKAGKKIEEIARQAEQDSNKPVIAPSNSNDYLSVRFDNGSVFSSKEFEINILQFLQSAEFSNPRTTIVAGRETILLDFVPRPNFVFKSEMKYFSEIKGMIWIDAADKKLVRLEGYPRTSNSALSSNETTDKSNLVVSYEQIRVPGGFWFFRHAELNSARHPNIFGKNSLEYQMTFSDYKRFRSEVEIKDETGN